MKFRVQDLIDSVDYISTVLFLNRHYNFKAARKYSKMNGNLRKEVLRIFKNLHRTRLNTFKNDDYALRVVRKKINEEYRKNMYATDREAIVELNKTAMAIEEEVRTKIIQAIEVEPGKFEAKIKEENLIDNAKISSTNGFSCNLATHKCTPLKTNG